MLQAAVGALLLLLGIKGPLMGVQPSQGHSQEAFVRDGVIFQLQGEVFFSDSEWVEVTEVSFGPIENTLNKLHLWFTDSAKKKESQTEETKRLGEGKTSGGTSYIPIRAMRCGSSVLYGQCGCVQHPVVPRKKRRRSYGRPSGTPTDGGGTTVLQQKNVLRNHALSLFKEYSNTEEERRELLRQASTLLHEADPSLTPSNKKKTSFHSQYWHSRIHDISEDELIFELQHHLEANGRIRLSDEHTKVSLLSLLALYPSLDTPVSLSELLNLRMGYTSVRFKT
ncbi:Uncharacterized protein APZ42_025265 [Daphnia magna]|uniref:Uncharacterized protein n=1 Tax=Daphnia magna TaxID=35525 RepID=A0A164TAH8_9CRUS|nr:Uncharacterized protein APZ42_025265 [Daphnia magna]